MKTYENIENTIIKENKLNHHIFTPNLLVFTKKYNDKVRSSYDPCTYPGIQCEIYYNHDSDDDNFRDITGSESA